MDYFENKASVLKTINKKGISAVINEAKAKVFYKYCYGKERSSIQVILECTEHKNLESLVWIQQQKIKNSPDRLEVKSLINP